MWLPSSHRDFLREHFKKELGPAGSMEVMEVIEEQKAQEELGDLTEEEGDTPQSSEGAGGSYSKEDLASSSPSGAEIESEFHTLSLRFKCDLVSLEKRLEEEERSRDQAEDNLRVEVSSCQELLQTLVPLREGNHQTMELIQRLQKNLDFLPVSMTRMSSRSETLGAIQQEKQASQAVEGMIQHVENLRRMYRTEHTELMELKESLTQEERALNPTAERDEFSTQKTPGSPYYPIWSPGDVEVDMDGLSRRTSWRGAGREATRPALHRFISTCAWMETNETSLINSCEEPDSPSNEEEEVEVKERKTRLIELGNKLTAFIMSAKNQDHPVYRVLWSFPMMLRDRSSWEWWTPLVLAVLLAGLLGLLGTLTLQPAMA
ncbi:hypothetical protein AAFF_G00231410 [Aldrovandia affinis]|uniref:Lymphoid-restricted membrane protein-like n=1 Tax=Aldrovandia affinis TaxID=143900 RepID=A0AAD7RFR3_9TELE|nr:hypothetical protein AAFF_G00231410 [Aldrovandia affinis]